MSFLNFFVDLFSLSNPLWYFYPLCMVVAVVYKMTKFDKPREIILAASHFFFSVMAGMLALSVVLYLVSEYL